MRSVFLSLAVIGPVALASPARAELIQGSLTQVGSWRVGAYSRGTTTVFDHCSLYRVQSEGFGVAAGLAPSGIWSMAMEAPDWGLTPGETYTTSILVGASSFTATGRATNARVMTVAVAPEIFGQMKSGVQLTASANHKRYTISLDGIEPATARTRDCTQHYAPRNTTQAMAAAPPSNVPAPATPPSLPGLSNPLIASVQTLLAKLGYDPGPSNGTIGLKTNIAIAAFQKSQGIANDGQPSEALRARLEKVAAERGALPAPPPANMPPKEKVAVSTGTGFYVSPDAIVTNFHVIRDCAEVRVRKNGAEQGVARVVAANQGDDLAALRTAVRSASYLKLRSGAPIKPAEPVLVFGYPLSGALSSAGNTTLGNVTALAGLRDDSRYIQISASVQPGNSGGPAVDDAGRLMGVVVSKLNALAIARVTGDIPQNVNFAIKVSTLANFLDVQKIAYETDGTSRELSNTQRAERAEAASVQLECRK